MWTTWRLLLVCPLLGATPRADFDAEARRWTLGNEVMVAEFRLGMAGAFEFVQLVHRATGVAWKAPEGRAASPVHIDLGPSAIDESARFRLLAQWTSDAPRGGLRQSILLQEVGGLGEVVVELDLYSNLPTLRVGVRYRNTTGRRLSVTGAEPLHWDFSDSGQVFRAMRVEQWLPTPGANPGDFERILSNLDTAGRALLVRSGAQGRHCTWLALTDGRNAGVALGWEFNGRMVVEARQWAAEGRMELSSRIPALRHPVEPGAEFQVPRSFLSLYSGTADDAAYMTHRFVEDVLAKPVPAGVPFPIVSWDSWAHHAAISEPLLFDAVERAAKMGVELFVVDLGWASAIGDWRADPEKFPSGLKPLSDRVHQLGMKFGLHFAFATASPKARVLEANPNWRTSSVNAYYGADTLCLSHEPVREWVVAEAIRMIDEYGVDWLLQDGDNMVPECTRTDHTHDPGDSNYANAVDGLDWVLERIQDARPNVLWENCENGGSMMTYRMVQQYVTSIVNDASGARASRQATYGALYPFPPRYADRYMPEEQMNSYVARSYLFGGPWVLMNRLDRMARRDLDYLAAEIERFKGLRGIVRDGKVLHLTNPPLEGRTDAMAAYDPATDSAVAVVTRDASAGATFNLRIGEFDDDRSYEVRFADDTRVLTFTGARLRLNGVTVRLPETWGSEVVYISPLR